MLRESTATMCSEDACPSVWSNTGLATLHVPLSVWTFPQAPLTPFWTNQVPVPVKVWTALWIALPTSLPTFSIGFSALEVVSATTFTDSEVLEGWGWGLGVVVGCTLPKVEAEATSTLALGVASAKGTRDEWVSSPLTACFVGVNHWIWL
jgi:hypothetical protein